MEIENWKLKIVQLKHLVRAVSPINDILAIFELKKLYKQLQPDIIHLNSSKASIVGSLAKCVMLRASCIMIYTAHGWVFNEPLNLLIKWFYKFLEKTTAQLKNKIIVLSDRDLDDGLKLGIPKEKLVKIPLGINLPQLLSKEDALKQIVKLSNLPCRQAGCQIVKNCKLIATIANLYPTKGLDVLIESIRLLNFQFPVSNFQFIIIGEGSQRPKLENLIKKYHLENVVFLLGTIKNAAEYLPAFDLFILPSRKEGTPYTILEAMSAGTPIISTTVGGIPSLLENKKEGILVEPENPVQLAEAISFALNNQEEMKKYAINAKNKIAGLTLEKMVQNTSSLYHL